MTDENLQSGSEPSSGLEAAEATLDNALATIKTGQQLKSVPESDAEFTIQEEEIVEESERKTLKLPERTQEKKFVQTDEPEVQKRINELYKNEKVANEKAILLQDELRRIADNAEQRENFLLEKLNKIEGRYIEQDDEAALSSLRLQYNEAIQNMDYDTASKINEKIVDFKTEKKINTILTEKNRAENNQRQQVKPKPVYSDPHDEADANRFQSEKAGDGSLARPWLQPNHPQFQDVIDVMAAISNGFIRKNQRPSLSAVMEKVDKWMGLGNQKGSSNQDSSSSLKHAPVLSSNTTLQASSDNQANKISDLERTYAAKLGVSDKDYLRIRKFSSSGPISMDNFKK